MGEFRKDQLPDPLAYYRDLAALKLTGHGSWVTTQCQMHGGSDSMRINVRSGAFVCMAGCGAHGGDVLAYHMAAHGLDFISAAKALGAWVDDAKPNRPQRPKPLPATDAIRVLAFESNLTAIAAGNLAHGVALTDRDRVRLLVAARRISHISGAFA